MLPRCQTCSLISNRELWKSPLRHSSAVSISSPALGFWTAWERVVSAGIRKTGAGTSGQLEAGDRQRAPACCTQGDSGLRLLSSAKRGRGRHTRGKERSGRGAILQWPSSKSSGHKERGDTRKVTQVNQPVSSYPSCKYLDGSWAARVLCGFTGAVRLCLTSLEVLPLIANWCLLLLLQLTYLALLSHVKIWLLEEWNTQDYTQICTKMGIKGTIARPHILWLLISQTVDLFQAVTCSRLNICMQI